MELGDRVKDKVSGFVGIITADTMFLNGCRRFGVTSEKLKDGQPTDAHWFDAPQLILIKSGVVSQGNRATGGPLPFKIKRTGL